MQNASLEFSSLNLIVSRFLHRKRTDIFETENLQFCRKEINISLEREDTRTRLALPLAPFCGESQNLMEFRVEDIIFARRAVVECRESYPTELRN